MAEPAEPGDTIRIRELRVPCLIGVTDEERSRRQEVVLDVTLHTSLGAAGRSDRLEDTVDYGELAARLTRLVESSSFKLLEALAEAVASACLQDPRVSRAEVQVDKPRAVPLARSAAVRIVRERKPGADPRGFGRYV
jgi:FolB domain-containing protein